MSTQQIATATETQIATSHALSYILAAKVNRASATVTLRSQRTGARFTYKISASEDQKLRFVKVLVGQDNESSYAYLGIINEQGAFRTTAKSKISSSAPSAVAFDWTLKALVAGRDPHVEIFHAGKCGRCGRKLTVPESIEIGLGPECAEKGWAA